jgi:hypothetical protein
MRKDTQHYHREPGRSRWRVDTELFQTLTTQAYLKQPSIHQTCALGLLTMICVWSIFQA